MDTVVLYYNYKQAYTVMHTHTKIIDHAVHENNFGASDPILVSNRNKAGNETKGLFIKVNSIVIRHSAWINMLL